MGFFAEFSTWLNGVLAQYIANNTSAIARLLEPAIVTLGVFYIVLWGYWQLLGKIEEPFFEGVKRLLTLALILGLSLDLWLYNQVIVDTFFNAPTTLAGGIIAAANPGGGAFDPVGVVDEIFFDGDDAASLLMQKGEIFGRDIVFYFAAIAVYIVVGLTAVYTMFLLALSKIALSVLIAMGPIFLSLLLFESTKRFFEAWIAQLMNYAFIAILTVLVAALMMHVVTVAAQDAVADGGKIQIANAARLCMASGLTFLVMRQVMPMAAGLASGLALSTFGVVSAALLWGLGGSVRGTGRFVRGLGDPETGRYDPLSRKAGHYTRRAVIGVLGRRWRDNQIREAR
jgi:type IV secretion system protein VirB6